MECAGSEGWLRGGDLEGTRWLVVVWGFAVVVGSVVGLSRLCLWGPYLPPGLRPWGAVVKNLGTELIQVQFFV